MLYMHLFLLIFLISLSGCSGNDPSYRNVTSTSDFLSDCLLHTCKSTMCPSTGNRMVGHTMRRNYCVRSGPRTSRAKPATTPLSEGMSSSTTRSTPISSTSSIKKITMSTMSPSTTLSTADRPSASEPSTAATVSNRLEITTMSMTNTTVDIPTTPTSSTTEDLTRNNSMTIRPPTTTTGTPTTSNYATTKSPTTNETHLTEASMTNKATTTMKATYPITTDTSTTAFATTMEVGTTEQLTPTSEPKTNEVPTTSKHYTMADMQTTSNHGKITMTIRPPTTDGLTTTETPTSNYATTKSPTTNEAPLTETSMTNKATTTMKTTDPITTDTSTTAFATTMEAGTTNKPTTQTPTSEPTTTEVPTTAKPYTTADMQTTSNHAPSKVLTVDQCDGKIKISDLPTISFSTFHSDPDFDVESVAYHSANQEVFWVNIPTTPNGRNEVCRMELHGHDGTTVSCKDIQDYCLGPRKIAIDETSGKVFVACSSNSRIIMMNLDFTSLQTLVDTIPVNVEFIAAIPNEVVFITEKEVRKFSTSWANTPLSTEAYEVHGLAIQRDKQKIVYAVQEPSATIWYQMNYDGSSKEALATTNRVYPPRDLEWYDDTYYSVEDGDIVSFGSDGVPTTLWAHVGTGTCPDVNDITIV